jgi:hypothetical protein
MRVQELAAPLRLRRIAMIIATATTPPTSASA